MSLTANCISFSPQPNRKKDGFMLAVASFSLTVFALANLSKRLALIYYSGVFY